ncbi:WD repeat domain phosphoinositide-interacting protein 3 [Saitoella coloradoensis]
MNLQRGQSRPSDAKGLLFAGFNQPNGDCFAVGLDSGFRVFSTDPLKERVRRDFADGGIGVVEMLGRTNLLALVGGGRNPKYPQNKAIIWDDQKRKPIFEIEFKSEVKAVRLRRDRIVVVLESRVHVYSFTTPPQKLHTFETTPNLRGLCALSTASSDMGTLAFPGRSAGQLQIASLPPSPDSTPKINLIQAHASGLSCLAMSDDGSRLATASETGTLIRVWNTATGGLITELRRGLDRAEIYSIAFSPSGGDSQKLCVSSDKGTIHVFHLPPLTPSATASPISPVSPSLPSNFENKKSLISMPILTSFLPRYFSSEWSFAQASASDNSKVEEGTRCIVSWTGSDVIVAVCGDGGWHKFVVEEPQPHTGGKGGKDGERGCRREAFRRFLGKDA